MEVPKTCKTCAHRVGITQSFAKCDYSGYFARLTRAHGKCGPDFTPWRPRQGVFVRIWQVFAGCKAAASKPQIKGEQ